MDAEERYRLAGPVAAHRIDLHPDEGGRLGLAQRLRGVLSRTYFEDRLEPVDQADGASGDGGGRTDDAISRGETAQRAGAA